MCRRDPSAQRTRTPTRRRPGLTPASCSMSSAARAGGSCSRDHAASSRARSRRPRLGQRALHRQAHRARRAQPPRDAHADAGPVDARGVLVHVAGGGDDDDRAAAGQRAREGAVAAVADDDVAARHRRARRRASRRGARSAGTSTGSPSGLPFQTARTRTGASARPRSVARSSRCAGSCEVEGATSTSGLVAGRQLDVRRRRLPQQRARRCASPAARPRAGTRAPGRSPPAPAAARSRRARGRAARAPAAGASR